MARSFPDLFKHQYQLRHSAGAGGKGEEENSREKREKKEGGEKIAKLLHCLLISRVPPLLMEKGEKEAEIRQRRGEKGKRKACDCHIKKKNASTNTSDNGEKKGKKELLIWKKREKKGGGEGRRRHLSPSKLNHQFH